MRDDETRRNAATAMDGVRRIVRGLRVMNACIEGEYRISAAQLFVLREIARQGGQSVADLARRTLTVQSSVSEVVARLITRGLVDRHTPEADRRRAEFTVTAAGMGLLETAPETVQERLVAGFMTLPDEERRALAHGITSWIAAAGLSDEPATMFLEPMSEAAVIPGAAGDPATRKPAIGKKATF
jgi:DNA-binding MarR family transcriptional regulator